MKFLDSIICGLHLLQVDNEDPYLSRFSPRSVPAIEYAQRHEPFRINHPQRQSFDANGTRGLVDSGQILQQNFGQEATVGCNCLSLTLGSQEPSSVRFTPLWGSTPAWSSTNEGEIRKESIRRLCWSSIIVAAGHVSYSTVAFMPPVQLAISNPANVSHDRCCRIRYLLKYSSSLPYYSPENRSLAQVLRHLILIHRKRLYGLCMIVHTYFGTVARRCEVIPGRQTTSVPILEHMPGWKRTASREY
jgi:hypothetical protein